MKMYCHIYIYKRKKNIYIYIIYLLNNFYYSFFSIHYTYIILIYVNLLYLNYIIIVNIMYNIIY